MSAPINVIDIFSQIETDLRNKPSPKRLRQIRDILDAPEFLGKLARELKAINDPDVLAQLLARLRRLWRDLEEKRDKKLHDKEIVVQMGVVGGVGLVGGSIVAAASATFPLVVLLPVVGGAWMAFRGYNAASRLDEERHLYEQLAERMSKIVEKCDDSA